MLLTRFAVIVALALAAAVPGAPTASHREAPASAFDRELAAIARRLSMLQRPGPMSPGSSTAKRRLAELQTRLFEARRHIPALEPAAAARAWERLASLRASVRTLERRSARPRRGVTTAAEEGSVSGTVTASAGGTPLADVAITLIPVPMSGGNYGFGSTDAEGHYTVSGLTPGAYWVTTTNTQGYLDEAFDDVPCFDFLCDLEASTQVTVTAGSAVSGIDLALDKGGRFEGTLTDAATGDTLAHAPVILAYYLPLFDSWVEMAAGESDASGHYVTGPGLPTGSYRARSRAAGYFNELYDDIECASPDGCDMGVGTPIAVTKGLTTGGIDFALVRAGSISGRVTDEVSGEPIGGLSLYVLDTAIGQYVDFPLTDDAGNYTTGTGLASGTYMVLAVPVDGVHLPKAYDNVPCGFPCYGPPVGSTPIPVSSGQATTGIDIALDRGGVIAGQMRDAKTGAPVSDVDLVLHVSGTGFTFFAGRSDDTGAYSSDVDAGALPPGTYFAHASPPTNSVFPSSIYLRQLYKDLPCPLDCDASTGTPIVVTAGHTTNEIDFDLVRGGTIRGQVLDAVTQTPLSDVSLVLFDQSGAVFFGMHTDAEGRYRSRGLPSGRYLVATSEPNDDYIDLVHPGIPWMNCLECPPPLGVPVRVKVGIDTDGIDFALRKGGKIAGQVVDSVTGAPLFAAVFFYTPAGIAVDFTYSDGAGRYSSHGGFPTGLFYAAVQAPGYVTELYDDVPCDTGCFLVDGKAILVRRGKTRDGIDFALDKVEDP
jgi:hypothetical protein